MTSNISLSVSSPPRTPTKTRTVTKTRSKVVEERTPDKGDICPLHACNLTLMAVQVVSRSVTYTRTVVETETPTRKHRSHRQSTVPTIVLSSDSEDTATRPPSPLSSLNGLDYFSTARSQSPTSSLSSPVSSTSSLSPSITTTPSSLEEPIPRTESDDTIEAYYQARYPGRVPHPNSYQSLPVNLGQYYVISGGKSVGIFTDWNNAAEFVLRVRNNKYQLHTKSWKAWLAYRHEWESKHIRVLGYCQDMAPLETQIAHMSLGEPATQESDDLLRVVITPTLFQGRQSISWALSGPAREGSTYVNVSRLILWIDTGDIDGSTARTVEDNLQLARSQNRKVTVLFLGFRGSVQEDMLSMLIPRLDMRYRADCLECQSISRALEHVYRMSLAINPYHVVHPHSPLFTDQTKRT
ncbi:hypothetical protein V5O48_010511, partial [Marasmius crinis-equi]